MQIIETPQEMQALALQWKREGARIGFVPTMGFLHQGHLSLVSVAKSKTDKVVVSIFVNPTQFGPNEDLDRYPRDFERDCRLCEEQGVDAIFYPAPGSMYDENFSVWVNEESLSQALCGISRPVHFRGVTTVVAKLFNIVLPDVAVFGQKDAQQAIIIERMVRDLNFPIELIIAPIVREADGLALSSRNKYLSVDERCRALVLSQSLKEAGERIANGQCSAAEIKKLITERINEKGGKIDYVEIVSRDTVRPVEEITSRCFIALAVYFGTTRLIDNYFVP